jgi:hypothetical protein
MHRKVLPKVVMIVDMQAVGCRNDNYKVAWQSWKGQRGSSWTAYIPRWLPSRSERRGTSGIRQVQAEISKQGQNFGANKTTKHCFSRFRNDKTFHLQVKYEVGRSKLAAQRPWMETVHLRCLEGAPDLIANASWHEFRWAIAVVQSRSFGLLGKLLEVGNQGLGLEKGGCVSREMVNAFL